MTKIAIIGAGGYVFPLRLVGDLLSFPELRDATIALMDIDADRLERTADAFALLGAELSVAEAVRQRRLEIGGTATAALLRQAFAFR